MSIGYVESNFAYENYRCWQGMLISTFQYFGYIFTKLWDEMSK